jgi:hypothetical protein
MPRSQAAGRATLQRERDRAGLAKERRIKRQERLDQYNEEYRQREQQGLSPPTAGQPSPFHDQLVTASQKQEDRSSRTITRQVVKFNARIVLTISA